jgi:mono/diheme cytochrome c family protein
MSRIGAVYVLAAALTQAPAVFSQAPASGPGAVRATGQLPDAPGRDVVQKACGSTCHRPDMLLSSGRTRDQWTAVVNSMVARGAKATEAELVEIITYLTTNVGPNFTPAAARSGPGMPGRPGTAPVTGRGPGPLGAGAADSHVVDNAGADRGKAVYAAECSSCHGLKARGGNEALPANQRGPDLIRSVLVLRDRYASEIGPFLAKGHHMRSGRSATALTKEQVGDLAHFLHQRVYYTLRSGPELQIQNVLTGDPKAGAAFFNGSGKCSGCHSITGDFAKIGSRYDPPTMQMKVLFPRTVAFGRGRPAATAGKPVSVTVTLPSGESVKGVLDKLDDFNVSLRDAEGEYRSFKITSQVKVVKNDPVEAHVTMLDEYSDKNIHDVVAYLESLK